MKKAHSQYNDPANYKTRDELSLACEELANYARACEVKLGLVRKIVSDVIEVWWFRFLPSRFKASLRGVANGK